MAQGNSNADYSIRFSAADPTKYAALTAEQYLRDNGAFPTAGNLNGTAARYLPGSDADLQSLAPQKSNPALGQIVVWDLVIDVSSKSAIKNGTITISLDWGLKTTSGADYGFDAGRGVVAAYVDTSASARIDSSSTATVTGKSSTTVTSANGDQWLRGDITIGGLDAGDQVTLEVWTVLRPDSTGKFTGVVQSQVAGAKTSAGSAIDVGTQTIPLKIDGSGGVGISGTAFEDKDSDGKLDSGEAGLAGWTITLTGPDGKTVTDTTDPKGAYAFNGLAAGTYTVTESLQGGYVLSAPAMRSYTVTLGSADVTGLDFGNVKTGQITGTVYDDANGSKLVDGDDKALVGVTIFLDANANGKLDAGEVSTKTDANGAYAFTGLAAGSYALAEQLPSGATQLLAPGKITLGYGDNSAGNNFLTSVPGHIAGTVYADTNGSKTVDAGDKTLAGVTVFLDANANGKLDAGEVLTKTDANGAYAFTGLASGSYALAEQLPSGATQTLSPSPVKVVSGTNSTGNDFLTFVAGRIDGTVYADTNGSKVVDGADKTLGNVTVFIDEDGDGNLDASEASTTTDTSGAFSFQGLAAGTYTLAQVLPGGATQLLVPKPVALAYGANSTSNDFLIDGSPSSGGQHEPNYGDDTYGDAGSPVLTPLGSGNDAYSGTQSADHVSGGQGGDALMGNGGDDQLSGDAGNDTVDGHDGNDTLWGDGGNDILHGLAGDDILDGGEGGDVFEGGDGRDIIFGRGGDDAMQGEGGNDTLLGGIGNDTLEGNAGRDLLLGGSGTDHLAGHDANDTLVGGADAGTIKLVNGAFTNIVSGDHVLGDGGADLFVYRPGDGVDVLSDFKPSEGDQLIIYGYSAFSEVTRIDATTVLYLAEDAAILLTDWYPAQTLSGPFPGITFVPTSESTNLTAAALIAAHSGDPEAPLDEGKNPGEGQDLGGGGGKIVDGVLRGTAGADRLNALGWNNRIEALAGDDTIDGGEGNAWIDAGAGHNTVTVRGWSNTILAGDGGTTLTGPQGNTTVHFGSGNHHVQLGGYSNLVELGAGNSTVETGEGNSTVRIAGGNNTVTVRGWSNLIVTGGGDDAIFGPHGNSTIDAGGGANSITLSGWSNRVITGAGNDVIVAGEGSATVDAGGGDDRIGLAGWGNHVRAGSGNDVVLLAAADGDGSIDGGAGADTVVLSGAVGEYRFGEVPGAAVYIWGPGTKSYQLTDVELLAFGGGTGSVPVALSEVLATAGLEELAARTGSDGASSLVLPDLYTGPVEYLRYQLLGSEGGEVVRTTASADFVNLLGGDDAADAGAGEDVVDGGLGSNFITGGAGQDVFFLDGRGSGTTWSTITDWQAGEQLSVWGWRPGVSRTTWDDNAGAEGWKGATLHLDFDANGTWDASVTWSGIARSELPAAREYDGLLWFA